MTLLLSLILISSPFHCDRSLVHKCSRGAVASPRFDTTHTYDALHYEVSLEVFFTGDSIGNCEATMTALSLSDTMTWAKLHLCDLTVDSVLLDAAPATYVRTGSGEEQLLEVDLEGSVALGDTFVITTFYHGDPSRALNILYALAYVMNIPPPWWYPNGARYWFPCYDESFDKVTCDLIVTVPEGNRVVGNGWLVQADTSGEDWTFHWREDYPISTYLIVFAAADYAVLQDTFFYDSDTLPIYHYVWHSDSANAVETFCNVPDMLALYSDSFGIYPFMDEKYGYVRLGNLGWAMENQTNVFWGLSIYGHNYEEIVAHEASHQWWGDALTPGAWRDVWLNEGFATYCEAIYSDHWEDGASYHDYMVGLRNYYLAYENSPVGHPFPIYDPPDLYNATTYEKGACLLHMLRHIIGDSVFFGALRTYADSFLYEVVCSEDLIGIFETASGQDLDWFFEDWLYGAGHPEYEWCYSVDSLSRDSFRIDLQVDQVQPDTWDIPVFTMPIDLEIYHPGGDTTFVTIWDSLRNQTFELYVDDEVEDIGFDPKHWVLKEAVNAVKEDVGPGLTGLRAFPTLTRDRVRFHYTVIRPGDLRLSVYDAAGRRVSGTTRRHDSSGEFTLTLDAHAFPAGVYFYRVDAMTDRTSGRFVVLR
jgi:aminopeptidase N